MTKDGLHFLTVMFFASKTKTCHFCIRDTNHLLDVKLYSLFLRALRVSLLLTFGIFSVVTY